jgi:Glyoxalase-like domain
MHKSKLAGFIIDCKTQELDAAASFWSDALGLPKRPAQDDGPIYRRLANGPGELYFEVQQVEHESRVHLDIETDDIDAEVHRLEQLGARRVKQIRTWWVLEAPTGQRFCVVRPHSPDFEREAHRWP